MMQRKSALILFVLAASVCTALAVRAVLLNFHLEGPPAKAADLAQVAVPTSSIDLPLILPLGPIERHVEATIQEDGPFLAGTLDSLPYDIFAKAVGLTPKTETKCELTETAKQAQNAVQCFNRATLKIDRAVTMGLAGLKALDEGKDDVLVCVAKFGIGTVDAAIRTSKKCINKVVPIALPARALSLKYSLDLQSFDLNMTDTGLRATASVKLSLAPAGSLPKYFDDVTKKLCHPVFAVSAKVNPHLSTDNAKVAANTGHGTLGLKLQVSDVAIGASQACAKNPTMQMSVFLDAIRPALVKSLPRFLDGAFSKAMTKTAITEDRDQKINARLSKALSTVAKPIELTSLAEDHPDWPDGLNLSLDADPQLVTLAEPGGHGKTMTLGLAVRANPSLNFAPPARISRRFVPISVGSITDRFAVTLASSVPLDTAQTVATQVARDIVAEHLSDLSISDLAVTLYQAGDRIVIGVELWGVGWLRLNGSVFLTARPEFDSKNDTVRLRDIKFDLDTSNFLLRRAAWVLETPVEPILEERLAFSIGPQMRVVREKMKEFRIPIPNPEKEGAFHGFLSGSLQTMTLGQVWLSENVLNVSGYAAGAARFEVDTAAALENLSD